MFNTRDRKVDPFYGVNGSGYQAIIKGTQMLNLVDARQCAQIALMCVHAHEPIEGTRHCNMMTMNTQNYSTLDCIQNIPTNKTYPHASGNRTAQERFANLNTPQMKSKMQNNFDSGQSVPTDGTCAYTNRNVTSHDKFANLANETKPNKSRQTIDITSKLIPNNRARYTVYEHNPSDYGYTRMRNNITTKDIEATKIERTTRRLPLPVVHNQTNGEHFLNGQNMDFDDVDRLTNEHIMSLANVSIEYFHGITQKDNRNKLKEIVPLAKRVADAKSVHLPKPPELRKENNVTNKSHIKFKKAKCGLESRQNIGKKDTIRHRQPNPGIATKEMSTKTETRQYTDEEIIQLAELCNAKHKLTRKDHLNKTNETQTPVSVAGTQVYSPIPPEAKNNTKTRSRSHRRVKGFGSIADQRQELAKENKNWVEMITKPGHNLNKTTDPNEDGYGKKSKPFGQGDKGLTDHSKVGHTTQQTQIEHKKHQIQSAKTNDDYRASDSSENHRNTHQANAKRASNGQKPASSKATTDQSTLTTQQKMCAERKRQSDYDQVHGRRKNADKKKSMDKQNTNTERNNANLINKTASNHREDSTMERNRLPRKARTADNKKETKTTLLKNETKHVRIDEDKYVIRNRKTDTSSGSKRTEKANSKQSEKKKKTSQDSSRTQSNKVSGGQKNNGDKQETENNMKTSNRTTCKRGSQKTSKGEENKSPNETEDIGDGSIGGELEQLQDEKPPSDKGAGDIYKEPVLHKPPKNPYHKPSSRRKENEKDFRYWQKRRAEIRLREEVNDALGDFVSQSRSTNNDTQNVNTESDDTMAHRSDTSVNMEADNSKHTDGGT